MRPKSHFFINLLALAALLISGQPAAAQAPVTGQPYKFKDLNTCSAGEEPAWITAFNNAVYLSADDGKISGHGRELWRSDGTESGTWMVKDINPGAISSSPYGLTPAGGTLYFLASTDRLQQLWKTDGTSEGTAMVRDFSIDYPGAGIGNLTAAGSTLYFTVMGGALTVPAPFELWRTDGTPEGTVLVKTLLSELSYASYAAVAMNGTLFFSAYDAEHGTELWKSDGTAAGTVLVADLRPGTLRSTPLYLIPSANRLYVVAYDKTLYVTDGTPGQVQAIEEDASGRFFALQDSQASDLSGGLFFAAQSADAGVELWHTGGTPQTTALVKDIVPGTGSSSPNSLFMRAPGGPLFFSALNEADALEWWRSDGTPGGTNPLVSFPHAALDYRFWNAGKFVYFYYDNWALGRTGRYELWRTDGTVAGTQKVFTLDENSTPGVIASMNGFLYFRSEYQNFKTYRTDGTSGGTVLINESKWYGSNSRFHILVMNGRLYFPAQDAAHGNELWESDGTAAGTHPLDMTPGPGSTNIANFVGLNGSLVYTVDDRTSKVSTLYAVDPPFTTPRRLKAFPFPNVQTDTGIGYLMPIGNFIYFPAVRQANDYALWRTDSTEVGTIPLVPGETGYTSASVPELIGSLLIFSVRYGDNQSIIWTTDGTPAGTHPWLDFDQGELPLALIKGQWLFAHDDGIHGQELWAVPLDLPYRQYLGTIRR